MDTDRRTSGRKEEDRPDDDTITYTNTNTNTHRSLCPPETNTTQDSTNKQHPEPLQIEGPDIDQVVKDKLARKISLHITPLIACLFLFCFIDKANIGNAKLAGLENDLGLRGNDFNIALTCYAVPYAVFQIPLNLLCKKVGPRWFLPACTIGFGIASVCTGCVRNRTQLFAMRIVLGIFESGTFPGMTYYLSRWYSRAELAFALSLFIVAAPLAGAFGGLLAYGIMKMSDFGSFHGWQKIFAIEGMVSIFLGIVAAVFLTDRPATARWLTPEEKDIVERRTMSERQSTNGHLDTWSPPKLWRGIKNPVVLVTPVVFCMGSFTSQGLQYFLPTIVITIFPEKSNLLTQLYTVPPHAAGIVLTPFISFLSWKFDRRLILLILCAIPIMIAYILFLSSTLAAARFAAAILVGGFCHFPACLTGAQISANVDSDTSRASAIPLSASFVGLAGIASTWAFLPSHGPGYHVRYGLNLASSSTWFITSICLLMWMNRDNKRRDARARDAQVESNGGDRNNVERLEYQNPDFMWQP